MSHSTPSTGEERLAHGMTAERVQLPALSEDTRAFWTGGSRGALEICHCAACKRFVHPPQPTCPDCRTFTVAPKPVSGRGRIMSFSINEQPWVSGQRVPFVLAVVELVEQPGLWLMTRIVGCSVDEVAIDMPVRVRFEQHEDVWLPLFEPEPRHG